MKCIRTNAGREEIGHIKELLPVVLPQVPEQGAPGVEMCRVMQSVADAPMFHRLLESFLSHVNYPLVAAVRKAEGLCAGAGLFRALVQTQEELPSRYKEEHLALEQTHLKDSLQSSRGEKALRVVEAQQRDLITTASRLL